MSINILIVDHEEMVRESLLTRFIDWGYQASAVENVSKALDLIERERFDLIISEDKLEDFDGYYLLDLTQKRDRRIPVVLMSSNCSIDQAVDAIKRGAQDFIAKPFNVNQIKELVQNLKLIERAEPISSRDDGKSINKRGFFDGLSSPSMAKLEDFIRRVAPTEATLLITGESGTGKSHLAREVHELSCVRSGPFIEVHCTTLPSELIESELFGHEKGAFTGATKNKRGKVQEAQGGTLFLDEIGELPPNGQAKLLRFLQEKMIDPVGATKSLHVDTRILAATNKNLSQMVKQGKFREDLYYRLNMFECSIVPLRKRPQDFDGILNKILASLVQGSETMPIDFESNLYEKLKAYHWPGNTRELKNILERLFYLSCDGVLKQEDLPEGYLDAQGERADDDWHFPVSLHDSLFDVELEYLKKILTHTKSLEQASSLLRIPALLLLRKCQQYGLSSYVR